MSTDSLIASLVGSLAWPLAAVLLGLIFRRQLRAMFASLAERMTHLTVLKAPGTEMSFGDTLIDTGVELQRMTAITSDAAATETPPGGSAELVDNSDGGGLEQMILPRLTRGDDLYRLGVYVATESLAEQAKESPAETVAVAWNEFASEIERLAKLVGVDTNLAAAPNHSFTFFANTVLRKASATGVSYLHVQTMSNVIASLWEIKTEVLKGRKPITQLEAYDYATVARQAKMLLSVAADSVGDSAAFRTLQRDP